MLLYLFRITNFIWLGLSFLFSFFAPPNEAHTQPRGWPRPLPGSLLRKLPFSSHSSLLSTCRTRPLYSPTLLDLVYLVSLFHIAYCVCRVFYHFFSCLPWWVACSTTQCDLLPYTFPPWFHSALNNYFPSLILLLFIVCFFFPNLILTLFFFLFFLTLSSSTIDIVRSASKLWLLLSFQNRVSRPWSETAKKSCWHLGA